MFEAAESDIMAMAEIDRRSSHGDVLIMKEKFSFALGRKLSGGAPNVRQEGAMRALWIVTFLSVLNFIDQSLASSVKVLFQKDLNLSDVESSYPTTVMVSHVRSHYLCLWCNTYILSC
jgi:hypothetical protein